MKNDSTFIALGSFLLTAAALVVGAALVESGQNEPEEIILEETADHIKMDDAHTRCGKYFVLETRSFSGFDVKQVHIVMPLSDTNVGLVGLYYKDIQTIIDESKDTPVLIRMKEESGREKDIVRLSQAAFDAAKECLPPPRES